MQPLETFGLQRKRRAEYALKEGDAAPATSGASAPMPSAADASPSQALAAAVPSANSASSSAGTATPLEDGLVVGASLQVNWPAQDGVVELCNVRIVSVKRATSGRHGRKFLLEFEDGDTKWSR